MSHYDRRTYEQDKCQKCNLEHDTKVYWMDSLETDYRPHTDLNCSCKFICQKCFSKKCLTCNQNICKHLTFCNKANCNNFKIIYNMMLNKTDDMKEETDDMKEEIDVMREKIDVMKEKMTKMKEETSKMQEEIDDIKEEMDYIQYSKRQKKI